MGHINKFFIRSHNAAKTLDVKIMDLQEDPKNLELLYDIMAHIIDNFHTLVDKKTPISDFDLVNYVLASALKSDIVDPNNLGLVVMYLQFVQAPSIYF